MQCGTGKKGTKLNSAISDSLVSVQKNSLSKDDAVVMKASKRSSRNLLIQSVDCDAINKSIAIPAQEFKDIQQHVSNEKILMIGPSTVS